MTRGAKTGFFFLALVAMACMALGSICAAAGFPLPSTLAFIAAAVLIVLGIVLRRRLFRRPESET